MVVDFSKINTDEDPILILKNATGNAIGVLGAATNIKTDIKYNESSVLEFNLPAFIDGIETPHYKSVIGMRTVELQDVGQFILVNPKETGDGIRLSKSCKAYSLEFEFTFKKITIENGTYNFWNPVTQQSTLLGMILEEMPSWSVGSVDSSLVGKYRTFEVNNENIYNFIKGTVQKSYNCIFDFDTFNRKINVIDVSRKVPVNPIYISCGNLAKSIDVEEDTESIVTRLDVNGADGVNIRDVNPSGTNKIINLDYFMTTDNFSQRLINKYFRWKEDYKLQQSVYYNLSVEYSMQTMREVSARTELAELENERKALYLEQATIIDAIAEGLKTNSDLSDVNGRINNKRGEIIQKEYEVDQISKERASVLNALKEINETVNFQNYFTNDEYLILDRYIKDDSVTESSFVYKTVDSYDSETAGSNINNATVQVSSSNITHIVNASSESNEALRGKDLYDFTGGIMRITHANSQEILYGNIVRGTFEYKPSDGSFMLTAYLNSGYINGTEYESACVSLIGNINTTLAAGTSSLQFNIPATTDTYLYFTKDTSEYEKQSVAWDLYDYGSDILDKLSKPSYKFSVSSADFLRAEDFTVFKNKLRHGEKLYVEINEDQVLCPVVIGAQIDWSNSQNFSLEFSDKYISGDSSFQLADLLEQSVSMGKTVDMSRFTYSAFVDSGASTNVRDFMTSALDVAKNEIISSKNIDVSWGDYGVRLRKRTKPEGSQGAETSEPTYDPRELWLINNNIAMTDNSWAEARLAIGQFKDTNLGDCYGVVAPNIVGTLLAGENLVIESKKQDNKIAVFKVDANGCVLHNSTFDIISGDGKKQIALDPNVGIAIGNAPLFNASTDGDRVINEDNAKFWVDTDGNLHFKGELHASTGVFTGTITANAGNIGGCEIVNGKLQIDAAYITKGKIDAAYIGNLNASNITTGTLKADRIEGLPASKITSEQFDGDRINGSDLTITEGSTIAGWKIDSNSIYSTNTTWGSGTFMSTGSNDSISIGGSPAISNWVFGAGGKFGVTKSGDLYASSANIQGKIVSKDITSSGKEYRVELTGGVIKMSDSAVFEDEGWAYMPFIWFEFKGQRLCLCGSNQSSNPLDWSLAIVPPEYFTSVEWGDYPNM